MEIKVWKKKRKTVVPPSYLEAIKIYSAVKALKMFLQILPNILNESLHYLFQFFPPLKGII